MVSSAREATVSCFSFSSCAGDSGGSAPDAAAAVQWTRETHRAGQPLASPCSAKCGAPLYSASVPKANRRSSSSAGANSVPASCAETHARQAARLVSHACKPCAAAWRASFTPCTSSSSPKAKRPGAAVASATTAAAARPRAPLASARKDCSASDMAHHPAAAQQMQRHTTRWRQRGGRGGGLRLDREARLISRKRRCGRRASRGADGRTTFHRAQMAARRGASLSVIRCALRPGAVCLVGSALGRGASVVLPPAAHQLLRLHRSQPVSASGTTLECPQRRVRAHCWQQLLTCKGRYKMTTRKSC